MLSCEPVSEAVLPDWLAALEDAADALPLATLALPDALPLAALALADADPLEDEQPANSTPPAKAAPTTPVSLIASRLEYERFSAEPFMNLRLPFLLG